MSSTKNTFCLIGRLTGNGEYKAFDGGGGVFSFGFAVTGQRKKVGDKWEDDPCFMDCKAFDSKEANGRKLGTQIKNSVKKGTKIEISGHVIQERWEKEGVKRQAYKWIVTSFTWCESSDKNSRSDEPEQPPDEGGGSDGGGDAEDDIPF